MYCNVIRWNITVVTQSGERWEQFLCTRTEVSEVHDEGSVTRFCKFWGIRKSRSSLTKSKL